MGMKKIEETNLLIVDDEEGIRKSLGREFELEGYNIFRASSGNKAFEVIKKENIHFVISDVKMPDGDGVSLLENIKNNFPDMPFVFLITGFAELTKEQALDKGAMDLMLKPPSVELLLRYMEKAREDL